MNRNRWIWKIIAGIALANGLLPGLVPTTAAQVAGESGGYERTYRQSKTVVESTLKQLQPAMSGHLPALEGFAVAGEHPLNHYQRAFYQSAVQVRSSPNGGSVVRVTTKVTAWYADVNSSRSGYQLLSSNGRLEADLLDQLTDLLTNSAGRATRTDASEQTGAPAGKRTATDKTNASKENAEPSISAPMPRSPDSGRPFSSSEQKLSGQQLAETRNVPKSPADHAANELQAEANSLEEVLRSQAHPKNLVAIKKTGTPVVESPSLTAKTLFLASAQDEFEMLDYSTDWVHVRISGLSRGWIWRTSLEMPEGISDVPTNNPNAKPVAADLFQVTREETAPFPGDWQPLRGKNVKIISVQKIQESEKDSGAEAKLEYAKSLFDKNYGELASKTHELAGVVLIFDSVDGGMIAATVPTVRQWKAGTLTDAALWHQCYFDPPETFTVPAPAGGH
ncbi:MAG: hypothetical protein ABSD53_17135 [Terriglobales bacterium]|jgi:hypothetical protein